MSGHFMFFAAGEVTARFMVCSFVPLLCIVYIAKLIQADKSFMGMAIAGNEAMTFVAMAMLPLLSIVFIFAMVYFYVDDRIIK